MASKQTKQMFAALYGLGLSVPRESSFLTDFGYNCRPRNLIRRGFAFLRLWNTFCKGTCSTIREQDTQRIPCSAASQPNTYELEFDGSPQPPLPSIPFESSLANESSDRPTRRSPQSTTGQSKENTNPPDVDNRELPVIGGKDSVLSFDPDWCSEDLGCGNMHVMCQYPVPGPSAKLPSASDMRMLEWDETLAIFAQRWADQCIYDPNILKDVTTIGTLTDTCHDLPGFDVGQVGNRIHGFNASSIKMENLVHILIDTISSNIFNVATHVIFSGYIPEDDYGAVAFHSQAYLIGCGVSSYLLDISTNVHRMAVIYCNLGPLNNIHLLDRYYKLGEPCSHCPSGTSCQPNSYFQFLCQRDASMDNPEEVYSSHYGSGSNVEPNCYFIFDLVFLLFVQFVTTQ